MSLGARFGSLFGALVALLGPSCGSFWRVVGPPTVLAGLCLGSFLVSFGALVAFGVRARRVVVDFSCHGGQSTVSETIRRVLEAISEAQNLQKPLKHLGFLHSLGKRRFKGKATHSKAQRSYATQSNGGQRLM